LRETSGERVIAGEHRVNPKWAHDAAHRRAVREGYRSRAVYKLRDIQKRFSVIRQNDTVVDLGAAPGSWLQELAGLTHGTIVGVDLNPIAPVEGTVTVVGDFTEPHTQEEILRLCGRVNIVVSDASPKLSGQRSYDQARAIDLGLQALAFAVRVLTPGGNFVVKSFQGEDFSYLLREVRRHFRAVHVYRPHATRKGSAETYIIGKNFIGTGTGNHDEERAGDDTPGRPGI
jgi:23S rRNA (uridine2552-2'-O)-methyltransferase